MPTTNPTADALIQGNMENDSDKTNQNLEQQKNTTQKVRVLSVKYKIYAFVSLLLLIIFYTPVQDAYMEYNATIYEIEQADLLIQQNIQKSKLYDNDISLINKVQDNIADVIICLNEEKGCEAMDEELSSNVEKIRTYLQLNNLSSTKMNIDEKIVLRNINEFLSQEDPFDKDLAYNGEIVQIRIGETRTERQHLKSFDVHVQMKFENKDALLKFIENIEKRVFYQPEAEAPLANTLLYKITGMDYDIVKYNDEQEITISMNGFYFSK